MSLEENRTPLLRA